MEKTESSKNCCSNIREEEKGNDFQELLQALPQERNFNGNSLYLYHGFWHPRMSIKATISFQRHFQAHNTDLIFATVGKSGTTWLKALTFMIVNRPRFTALEKSPLLTMGPHELIHSIEFDLYLKSECPNLEDLPSPRIFETHMPYASLPCSIKEYSDCRIVYLCRNPLDQFISLWHFLGKFRVDNVEALSTEESFEMYCKGIHGFGPFWDHVLGYWKASLERSDEVLFLKYEDLKEDIDSNVKRLAQFMGFPFSLEEEKQGVVQEISRLCSFETLKNLEVNKKGKTPSGAPISNFFREGKVGDWRNYLTPSMADHMVNLTEEKFGASGLTFNMSLSTPKGSN